MPLCLLSLVHRLSSIVGRGAVLVLLCCVVVVSGCAHEQAYKRGAKLSRQGQYDKAVAELEEAIKRYDVPAIFVSTSVNPQVAEQIAADTGIKVVSIYTGSLSDEQGPASTYLDYMRYDVSQIVAALQPE